MADVTPPVIDITQWSHEELRCWLASYPDVVLPALQRHGIDCLVDVPAFQDILEQMPAVAVQIALMAANMGIKVGDEDIDQGDVLNSLKPGEV